MSGRVYLAEQINNRISEFTAWGTFVKTWGWDVVTSGPGDDTSAPEDEFEVCIPARGDICKAGLGGGGRGQITMPQGLAIDSDGNLYAIEGDFNGGRRVQKFDPTAGAEFEAGKAKVGEAEFLLMAGGKVNETSGGNLCPRPGFPADVCKAAVEGNGPGEFVSWVAGSTIAIGPADQVYVGDRERIQRFDKELVIKEVLPDPDGILVGVSVKALAVESDGGLLVSRAACIFCDTTVPLPNVLKLDPTTGKQECEEKVDRPSAIAADPVGGAYVVSGEKFGTPPILLDIVRFDAKCKELERFDAQEEGVQASTGIAANAVSGEGGVDLYVPNSLNAGAFLRAYGPPPIKWLSERPEVGPDIDATFATAVSSANATVKAQINPHFFEDTRYYVQYGTGKCSEGGCLEHPTAPGTLLTSQFVDEDLPTAGVLLSSLQPSTTYNYRFVATSGGGGPVFGQEHSFHTPPVPGSSGTACPNQPFRTGPSAQLPDCRAYEAVSPLEKNGDVGELTGIRKGFVAPVEESDGAGEKVTYASASPFGPQQSAPYVFQYLASRDPETGWSSRSLNPPADSVNFYYLNGAAFPRFLALSPDLCHAFYQQADDRELAPGAQPGIPDLYQADLCGEEDAWRTLTTSPPSNLVQGTTSSFPLWYTPVIQGLSSDGQIAVFRANGALTEDANESLDGEGRAFNQLYAVDAQDNLRLVNILPDESSAGISSAGEERLSSFGSNTRDNVHRAVSEDGSHVWWSAGGHLYLRLNPIQPQSAQELGSAHGIGNTTAGSNAVTALVTAKGKGGVTAGSSEVTELETSSGEFLAGQTLRKVVTKIPAGTKILSCSPECGPGATSLTLDQPAENSGSVTLTAEGPMPFGAGQSITGPGIPPETTITEAQAGKLTLSANATATSPPTGVDLSAFSACTEPQKACTLPVSETVSSLGATFEAAAADGSLAIFKVGSKLYEFDAEAAIAGKPSPSEEIADGVIETMGASEDAKRVYFASTADLGAGPNPLGIEAVAGQPNLYLHEREGPTAFIGTLAEQDRFTDGVFQVAISSSPVARTSRVSHDGLHAAFSVAASLTGYDNGEVGSGQPAAEVYLYEAAAGGGEARLVCASCNPSGRRPQASFMGSGNNGAVEFWTAARVPVWNNEHQPSRALSEDGRFLFFESFDALLPGDSNDAPDVYQWEAAGSDPSNGRCTIISSSYSPDNGGCLDLISSGRGSEGGEFLDASANGSDVFFLTGSSLVAADPGLRDVYDARIGGGFPPPIVPRPPCEGEACQPSPPAPEGTTPASSSVIGPGDPVPPKGCRKGRRRVQRHGKVRCVKAKHSRRRARHSGRAAR